MSQTHGRVLPIKYEPMLIKDNKQVIRNVVRTLFNGMFQPGLT